MSPREGQAKRITVTLADDDYREICTLAKSQKVSASWIVRDAIDQYLSDRNPLIPKISQTSAES